jgi:photosystem II stability/assembly factor-like uncharacterized protein
MINFFRYLLLVLFTLLVSTSVSAQKPTKSPEGKSTDVFSGFKFRNIGPALMSGRIADIAIHPENINVWYVAVGSGGVWKTENSGTTWNPIFDSQGSYSIGCITIDPSNPERIWVGTGENVGGRHVGYGDGIYKSDDGGKSWKNMGLKTSEHISKIIVHPANPDIVWVASQGPLWSKGGERGVYKTSDGGKNWKRLLGDDNWTGATDLLIDPRNPDRIYAATWQRHRTVAAYMGGGPGTAIYRSEDGGENWDKLSRGLPSSDMGKIGLALSPQKPDVVYAAIELDRRSGGVYKSTDRGASWTKMSDAVAGGTGPHYYQELYACPHQFDRLYLVDVYMQISDDGGKTFRRMNEQYKHVDNHAIAFRSNDPNYLLVGNDGGLYETFDLTRSWKYVANLPVTQFYKVAVDDDEPFYNVYGGTQDNNTQGGPSRTDNVHGIRNADWFVTLFGDGHQPATEPGNPNIVYSQWQQGNLVRYDRITGEIVLIKPQPEENEGRERFNWDAPILVSPHKPERLFFASQRVWQSEDRGDSWKPISGDLTNNRERIEEKLMDQNWSWDSPWDLFAMSDFSTITSLSESPVKEGLIWAGTDDGLIQFTEDFGKNWKAIKVTELKGVPESAFVNDIKADLFDASTVYVVLDDHKAGNFKPYIFKSTDNGTTWSSISSNLPERNLLWRVVQDHEKPELMFVATETGIWFTIDAGSKWHQLKGGLPVISIRDLAIQKRENDLVAASFGRGFFILDDYSALRHVSEKQLQEKATLFPLRDALWYIPRQLLGDDKKASQGDAYYVADNPPFGAVFTIYLSESWKSAEKIRQEKEAELRRNQQDIKFPGWDVLEKERRSTDPSIWLVIKDSEGDIMARIEGPKNKGFHRVAWDLRMPSNTVITDRSGGRFGRGPMVAPGKFSAELYLQQDGNFELLSGPQFFEVKPLRKGSLKGSEPEETAAFWKELQNIRKGTSAASIVLQNVLQRLDLMEKALVRTPVDPSEILKDISNLRAELYDFDAQMNGNRSKQKVGEKSDPTINDRLSAANMGTSFSTFGPTATHKRMLEIASKEFSVLREKLEMIRKESLPAIERKLSAAGAPWIEGQEIPEYSGRN